MMAYWNAVKFLQSKQSATDSYTLWIYVDFSNKTIELLVWQINLFIILIVIHLID